MTNYPHNDREVKELADTVWGEVDGKGITGKKFGKGRVVWGKPLAEVLRELGAKPDFQYAGARRDARLEYIHRRNGDAEIYFVANCQNCPVEQNCTFRVSGKLPELWDPITGARRDAVAYQQTGDCTEVPLEFAPNGSMFIVFRKPIAARPKWKSQVQFPGVITGPGT